MTGFSRQWLSLREPLDAASRAPRIVQTLNRVKPDRPLQITDLASGTGANLRYLSGLLEGRQDWRLIDHDQDLLDAIPGRMGEWTAAIGASVEQSGQQLVVTARGFQCSMHASLHDLAADLAAVKLPAAGLVTASALLDLVSETWLQRVVQLCVRAGAPVLFALNYDGRVALSPGEPGDAHVTALINRHQTTDKGFGPALGPAAADAARQRFSACGYHVESERSDWLIRAQDQVLQEALIDGWLDAAIQTAPREASVLRGWHQRRRAHIAAERSEIRVGHIDVLCWPPE